MARTPAQKAKRALARILANPNHPVVLKASAKVAQIREEELKADLTYINTDHAQTTTFCARHAVENGQYRDGFLGLTEFEADCQRYEARDRIPLEKAYDLEYEQKINKQRHDKKVMAKRTHIMASAGRPSSVKSSRIRAKESRVVNVSAIQKV